MRARRIVEGQYAAAIRVAMAEQRRSIRDLSKQIEFSYEHVRKVAGGSVLPSQACHLAICRALGLDPAALWQLVVSQKVSSRFGALAGVLPSNAIGEFGAVWSRLTETERHRLVRIADGWIASREPSANGEQP